MNRREEIKANLEYAERLRQELLNDMFLAKKQNIKAKNIVHNSGTILSTARECYDYCAQDIFESFILLKTSNSNLVSLHNNGRSRIYFPFYESELTTPGSIFYELSNTHPALHDYLIALSQNISNKCMIPGTLFNYGKIIDLKEMVNQKKHDRLLIIKAQDNQEILIEKPGMAIIIPIKKQRGWNSISLDPESELNLVSEFLFEFNKEEVGDFCLFAVKSGEIIFNEIYSEFF